MFSIVLVLLNKRLVVDFQFKFMTVLSGLHFAVSFLLCVVFIICGLLKYKSVNSYWSVFRISLVMCTSRCCLLSYYTSPNPYLIFYNTGITPVGNIHELLLVAQFGWILPGCEAILHPSHVIFRASVRTAARSHLHDAVVELAAHHRRHGNDNP